MSGVKPTMVYILDTYSYDARGGDGKPFATVEGAMAARQHVEWEGPYEYDGEREWVQKGTNDYSDRYVILERPLGP